MNLMRRVYPFFQSVSARSLPAVYNVSITVTGFKGIIPFLCHCERKRSNLRKFRLLRRSAPRNDARTGFTLIELIMTIVVVSIIAIPLSLLLSQHLESTFQSEDYTMAVNLGRFEMEKVNNLIYDSIVSQNSSMYNYDITRTVVYVKGDSTTPESLKQIRVEVRRAGSAAVLVNLVTYLARNVNYGV